MLRRLLASLPILGLALHAGGVQSQAISYNFSWTASGSLSQSFTDATFGLSITGNPSSVFSASGPGGVPVYLNTGAPDGHAGTLSGTLTAPAIGLGPTTPSQPYGVFTDVGPVGGVMQTAGVGFGAVIGGSVSTDFLTVSNPNFPGLAGYTLQSSFGPMTGAPGLSGGPFSLALGNSTQLNFTGIGNETFEAITGIGGNISYNFSWTASGSLSQSFTDATFGLSITGNPSSVFSASGPGGVPVYLNTGAPDGHAGTLSGTLTAPAIGLGPTTPSQPYGVFTDVGPVGGVMQTAGVGFGAVIGGSVSTDFLTVSNPNFPGLAGYTLQSSFGPMTGAPGLSGGPFSLALGNSTQLNFTGIGSETFEAVSVHAIPEPEIYAMLGMGLGLLGWVGRRRRLKAA